MDRSRIPVTRSQLAEFCRRWQVTEFAVFGSVLRDDFRPDSDIDVVVTFASGAQWSLFDLVDMRNELETLFGHPVDLVERDGLRNPFRRRAILSSMQVLYGSSRA